MTTTTEQPTVPPWVFSTARRMYHPTIQGIAIGWYASGFMEGWNLRQEADAQPARREKPRPRRWRASAQHIHIRTSRRAAR